MRRGPSAAVTGCPQPGWRPFPSAAGNPGSAHLVSGVFMCLDLPSQMLKPNPAFKVKFPPSRPRAGRDQPDRTAGGSRGSQGPGLLPALHRPQSASLSWVTHLQPAPRGSPSALPTARRTLTTVERSPTQPRVLRSLFISLISNLYFPPGKTHFPCFDYCIRPPAMHNGREKRPPALEEFCPKRASAGWTWSLAPGSPGAPLCRRAPRTASHSKGGSDTSRLTFDGASRLLEAGCLGAPAQSLAVAHVGWPRPGPRAGRPPGPLHQPAGPPEPHAAPPAILQRLVHPVGSEGRRVVEDERDQGHQYGRGHNFPDGHRGRGGVSRRGESPSRGWSACQRGWLEDIPTHARRRREGPGGRCGGARLAGPLPGLLHLEQRQACAEARASHPGGTQGQQREPRVLSAPSS